MNVTFFIKSNVSTDVTFLHLCFCKFALLTTKTWGHAVAQLVEALRYKLEGRGFDSRGCH